VWDVYTTEPELELELALLLVSIGDTLDISLLLELVDVRLEEEAGIGVVAVEPTNRPLSGPFRETVVLTIGETRFQSTIPSQDQEMWMGVPTLQQQLEEGIPEAVLA